MSSTKKCFWYHEIYLFASTIIQLWVIGLFLTNQRFFHDEERTTVCRLLPHCASHYNEWKGFLLAKSSYRLLLTALGRALKPATTGPRKTRNSNVTKVHTPLRIRPGDGMEAETSIFRKFRFFLRRSCRKFKNLKDELGAINQC